MDKIKKWLNVPVSDVINMRTGEIGDLLDGTMLRLDTIGAGRVQAFMDGDTHTVPDQAFYTDLRTALTALSTLRNKHFNKPQV